MAVVSNVVNNKPNPTTTPYRINENRMGKNISARINWPRYTIICTVLASNKVRLVTGFGKIICESDVSSNTLLKSVIIVMMIIKRK